MASFKRQKVFVRSVLVLYAFITVTFPLAHRDFVPLKGAVKIIAVSSLCHALDVDENDLVCPAHQFAQSTTGTPVSNQISTSQTTAFILPPSKQTEHFIEPTSSYSTRAPPQA
jgi:hypothetical protein